MSEILHFDPYLARYIDGGGSWASKYRVKGKVALRLALDDARSTNADPELIRRVEHRGMISGDINMTYQGAVEIYNDLREIALSKRKVGEEKEWIRVIDELDPVKDHEIIANLLFTLDPDVRRKVGHKIDSLYRVVLNVGAGKRKGYHTSLRERQNTAGGGCLISPELERIVCSLPTGALSEENEESRRLRIILDEKAEKEIFPIFKEDVSNAFKMLKERIDATKNDNLREAYGRLEKRYQEYVDFQVHGVNPDFTDPETGEKGTLPSLHQKIALYHLSTEKRFGVFDGCGTGKTAIGALALPLIEERMKDEGKELKRVIVIGPNNVKKIWREGLAGELNQRYLESEQRVAIINGGIKDNDFMESLKDKRWIVLNYEQLITRINGGDKLFVEALAEQGIDYLIIDESHKIKECKTSTPLGRPTLSAATRYLAQKSEYLVLLSGTPIPDNLDDYSVPFTLLNPELCPDPKAFKELYKNEPRVLYTYFNERTIRRTSEDINNDLSWGEEEVDVELTPMQRQVYDHIIGFRPTSWIIEARKAIIDPRLVDPEILKRAGALGKLSVGDASKYRKLEEMISENDGPLRRGEKFVIFSTMFRDGVTQAGNENLRQKYSKMGILEEFDRLQLNKSLDEILCEGIRSKTGMDIKIGVIDGTVIDFSEREKLIDRLRKDLSGLLLTTDTGGESFNLTAANWVFFLDRDYGPTTEEQALARVLRKGQEKKVHAIYLNGENSMDGSLRDYVMNKKVVITIASDGYPVTEDEWKLLNDTEGKQFGDLIKQGLGGISINVYDGEIEGIADFGTIKRNKGSSREVKRASVSYSTTEAQELMKMIGRDPVNCWKNPEFVELYMRTLPNLSVPVVHRAKICNLVQRAKSGEIKFPERVISEGSGPSLLYDSYNSLRFIVESNGFSVPYIVDRDFSFLMHERGSNPNKILGDMTGKDSAVKSESFDMVDNESISLLKNPEEVKFSLMEANRILKPEGLIELIVKNMRFKETFYSGLEELGFEVITGKNEGFVVAGEYRRRLREELGEHFADAYAQKLASTHLIIARKKDSSAEKINSEQFWFEPIQGEECSPELTHFMSGKKKDERVSSVIDAVAREIERESKGHARRVKGEKVRKRINPDEINGLKEGIVHIEGEF